MNTVLSANIVGSILFGLAASLAGALACIRIAQAVGLMDVPGAAPHKQHQKPTPLAGGMALGVVLFLAAGFYGTLFHHDLRGIYAGALVIFLFALLDDFKGLSPLVKLAGQSLAVLILISLGVYIRIFESPGFFIFGLSPLFVFLDWALTAFWIIGLTNAFNFVDSMDGLAVALAGIAAAFFILVTIESNQPVLTEQSALLLGACIGLYFFNAPPARLFLGDAGAQTLGFLLASLAIVYTPQGAFQTSSWFVPILILGVPIFDMALVVVSRWRRGKAVYQSSCDHTYHRLVQFGLEPNRAVLFMHIVALLLCCTAFIALGQPPLQANLIFLACLLTGAAALAYGDAKARWP